MDQRSCEERAVRMESRVGRLAGVLHLPAGTGGRRPRCVVGSHGLFSDRESTKLMELGRELVGRGLAFLRYDCMGIGESGGDFAETTLASRVADVGEAVAWARRQPDLDGERIGLMGSSMGGFASLCHAAADTGVAAVAAWAAPATFEDLHDEERDGRRPTEPSEAHPLVLGPVFYRTLHTPHLPSLARSLTSVLFLHGEDDATVPLEHGRKLYRLAREPKRLEVFPGGDHRFSDPVARARAVTLTADWLAAALNG